MIIKSSRIKPAGVRALKNHVMDVKLTGRENEAVSVVHGDPDWLHDFAADALAHGKTYGCRHWIINPSEAMRSEDVDKVIAEIVKEYGFKSEDCILIEHQKKRSGPHIHCTGI